MRQVTSLYYASHDHTNNYRKNGTVILFQTKVMTSEAFNIENKRRNRYFINNNFTIFRETWAGSWGRICSLRFRIVPYEDTLVKMRWRVGNN